MQKIINSIKLVFFIKKWKKLNAHNSTYPGIVFNPNDVIVGNFSYGQINVKKFGSCSHKLVIKNYCSIANDVLFLIDGGHRTDTISTFPFRQILLNRNGESTSKGDIILDDDVWIGTRSLILSGVHIGQGAVVAAGAVVTKDIPPYAIVAGVPAKVIKYRFESDLIEELLKIDYNKIEKSDVEAHIADFYKKLEDKSQLEWFPKIEGVNNNECV